MEGSGEEISSVVVAAVVMVWSGGDDSLRLVEVGTRWC